MPNKLIITTVTGGFDAQLEIDGRLSAKDFFDCSTNPVINTATGTCPSNGNPLVQICNDKGEKSAAVADDCIVLDGVPVLPADIYTFIEGVCPVVGATTNLATEATQTLLLNAILSLKDGEFLTFCDPNDNDRKVALTSDLTDPANPIFYYTYLDDGTAYAGSANDLEVCGAATTLNPVNISDKLKIDGLTGSLTACTSYSFSWSATGSGVLVVTNVVTGRVTNYPFSEGLAPFNAIDNTSQVLEDYTFDATGATGLYLSTQGCRIVT